MDQVLIDRLRKFVVSEINSRVHSSIPGKIVSVINDTRVDVQVGVLPPQIENTNLIIYDIPYSIPNNGRNGIRWKPRVGETVTLLFSERSLEEFLSGNGNVVKTKNNLRFQMTDAVAIPGVFPDRLSPKMPRKVDVIVESRKNKIQIMENGDIELGDEDVIIKENGDIKLGKKITSLFKRLVTEELKEVLFRHTHGATLPDGTPTLTIGGIPFVSRVQEDLFFNTLLTDKVEAK